ncbi:carboxylesterase family protein [Poriferisphaera corsica]|nr:hypothetical protein [Poriferisphaera corsica]
MTTRLTILLFAALLPLTTTYATTKQDILNESIAGTHGRLNYRYVAAENVTQDEKLPLVIFLHGSGEAGTDNKKQLASYMHPLYDTIRTNSRYKAHFLAPQDPTPGYTRLHHGFIDHILNTYDNIDPNRVYITGVSAGGVGTLESLAHFHNKIAAALTLGAPMSLPAARMMAQNPTPLWMIVGSNDHIVPLNNIAKMYNQTQYHGSQPRLTLIPNQGHWDWDRMYSQAPGYTNHFIGGSPLNNNLTDIYDWMFTQKLDRQTVNTPRPLHTGESIRIDFGLEENFAQNSQSIQNPNNYWNDIVRNNDWPTYDSSNPDNNILIKNAITTTGHKTKISITLNDAFRFIQSNNIPNNTAFDDTIMNDSWVVGHNWQNRQGKLLITGLEVDQTYNIKIFAAASITDTQQSLLGTYTLGEASQTWDLQNTATPFIEFENITTNQFGQLLLTISTTPGNFAHISALEITAIPEPNTLAAIFILTALPYIRHRTH